VILYRKDSTMFTVTLHFNEDDYGWMASTEVTVFRSLADDTEVLTDLYGTQMMHHSITEDPTMTCEICTTPVLRIERGVFGTPIITEFAPFMVDDGDNGSGVIQCLPCMLQGVAHGVHAVTNGEAGRGAHRAA
jgi:hypothetical protein